MKNHSYIYKFEIPVFVGSTTYTAIRLKKIVTFRRHAETKREAIKKLPCAIRRDLKRTGFTVTKQLVK